MNSVYTKVNIENADEIVEILRDQKYVLSFNKNGVKVKNQQSRFQRR